MKYKFNFGLIGVGIIFVMIANYFSLFYTNMNIESQIFAIFGTILTMFGILGSLQEKDKGFFDKIQSTHYFRSFLIIILCVLIISFVYLKIEPAIILGFFSITVMLFLFTKLHSNKEKESRELEIYIDSRAIVTGVQISLTIIFASFYVYFFYYSWVSNTEPNSFIFLFIFIITAFLLLTEILKIYFTKMYQ